MQCRTCGEHGKEGLSSLDPEHASLLPQLAACSSFVCHDCIVDFKHWRHFLTRFQTSQTLFQQVLESKQHSDSPQKTDVEPSLEKILPKCRVLVPKLLECEMCSYFTTNKSQLATHMQDHQSRNTSGGSSRSKSRGQPAKKGRKLSYLQCTLCGIKYVRPEMFAWHTENCHGADAIAKVVKRSNRKLHSYQCMFCEALYDDIRMILQHLCAQHRIRKLPYPCSFCDKQFLRDTKLKRHHLTCKNKNAGHRVQDSATSNINKIKCKMCNDVFESETLMRNHVSMFHAARKWRFKCGNCDETFNYIAHLKSHCRSNHSGNQIMRCDICKAGFSSYSGYQQHKKFKHAEDHDGFTCNICSFTFRFQSNLINHVKNVHARLKKSLKCNFCSKKFKCKRYLYVHVQQVHTGQFLLCDHCDYTTRIRNCLIGHLKSKHTFLKKTLSCKICSKKFNCKYRLNSHVYLQHSGPVLKCYHCEFSTRYKRNLTKHIQRLHP